jgi:hypothetical protein
MTGPPMTGPLRRPCRHQAPLLKVLLAASALLALLLLLQGAQAGIPTTAAAYNPYTKDWASVIAACRQVGKFEKRINSFLIRTAFHDSLSVTQDCSDCGAGQYVRCTWKQVPAVQPICSHVNISITAGIQIGCVWVQ